MADVEIKSGTCRFCGCRDARACEGGCFWIDDEHTVCSSPGCVDKYFAGLRAVFDRLLDSMRAVR